MTAEIEKINTSVGRPGPSLRQYGRLYVNGKHLGADYGEVETNFGRLVGIAERRRKRIGRAVYRGLVTEEVAQQIVAGPLQPNLEVAFPVGDFTGDDSHLIYLGQNSPERTALSPQDEIIRETEHNGEIHVSPREYVRRALDAGFTITNQIGEDQVGQVFDLWSDTFGWTHEEVENLRERIQEDLQKDPLERKLWFSAVVAGDEIVSLAMAERLSLPAADGGFLDLVESTEWKTRDGHGGNGLISATLANLNLQIIADLWNNPNKLPLIYAECNYQSRADKGGRKVGFTIPDRNLKIPAPQILVQNVLVQDGVEVPEGALRDFNFMYLPLSVINGWYNPNNDH